jgi:class 3 adenylate cyclase
MDDRDLQVKIEQDFETLRTSMTILFSDIKGSTKFAEKRGDVEYMAMIDRHNRVLFPVIEAEGGVVVKTIGDAILARFDDAVAAVKAAAGMQRALASDRKGRDAIDQIRIRIGMHYGVGLVKDNDVFGDVVNAASHIEHQAEAGQILITDALLEAAQVAGFECAKMGRADLKGKVEPIDLYAVAWSEFATAQLIEEVERRYEKKIKELKVQQDWTEEKFDKAHAQWRTERRTMNQEIEGLHEALKEAREKAQKQLSDDLQAEFRFRIEQLLRSKQQLEDDLSAVRERYEAERNNLKTQIAAMQTQVIDGMARSNNPARSAMAVREQVEARIVQIKEEWESQWQNERKRLIEQIGRLDTTVSLHNRRTAAKHALLHKLGKLPAGAAVIVEKGPEDLEREFRDAQMQWQTDRDELNAIIKRLRLELQQAQDVITKEIVQPLRAEYEQQLAEATYERQRLQGDIQFITGEAAGERQRLNARIEALEKALPESQDTAKKQALAEVQAQLASVVEEANRARSRIERNYQESVESWEDERRRTKKQIAALEEQLREARDAIYKAKKTSAPILPGSEHVVPQR